MGVGSEDPQSVDIDWNEYVTDIDEWGQKYILHDRFHCQAHYDYTYSLQEAIDWALDHETKCIDK